MIIDLAQEQLPNRRPQVLIIGAGAVGITLAVDLARSGTHVMLCESGGRNTETAAQDLNNAIVLGRPHSGIKEGRARVLGGTTTLWGGQLIAFREIDFQARPWLNLPAWPINRQEISRYYESCATMLGLPLKGDDETSVWHALKMDPPNLSPDLEFVLTRWLKEANLARMFASELKNNPNLNVVLHASATGFAASDDGRITSVEICSSDGKKCNLSADAFVVATGTIEASRLMLAAAKKNPRLPWSDNDWVGAAFQDHLELRAATVHPINKKLFNDTFDNIFLDGYKYNPKITLSTSIQNVKLLTNVGGVFTFESSISGHLSNIKIFLKAIKNGSVPSSFRSIPKDMLALMKVWYPLVVRYLRDSRAFNPADLGIGLRVHCEQIPLQRSRILLDPDKCDRNGVPLAVLDWQIDGREMESVVAFCEVAAAKLEQMGLAKIDIDPRLIHRDFSIIDEARDTNHHCGGLQMADTCADGVVNGDLRVHGTKNLYVAGAAVFPSSSFANPTFTAMALALRLADHIRRGAE